MIEIKNKHMIIFPEDRLIGARGDVDSAQRKFVLSRVQDGFDLSNMVAWIKIDPTGSGAEPYDQMLKKEISGDRIILTWRLSGANLKDAGELSAQIIFASPDYFNQNDLANLSDNALIVPSAIKGISAPVWQSYPETFVVSESIDDTVAYEEITKNVLVAAAASAVASAESAQAAAESAASAEGEAWQAVAEVSKKAKEAEKAALVTIELKDEMQGIANEAKTATQEANEAAADANQAAINANAVREEVEAGGYIESLKEMNEGEKFSVWVGTQAEYEADPNKLTGNRLHILTDETDPLEPYAQKIQDLSANEDELWRNLGSRFAYQTQLRVGDTIEFNRASRSLWDSWYSCFVFCVEYQATDGEIVRRHLIKDFHMSYEGEVNSCVISGAGFSLNISFSDANKTLTVNSVTYNGQNAYITDIFGLINPALRALVGLFYDV